MSLRTVLAVHVIALRTSVFLACIFGLVRLDRKASTGMLPSLGIGGNFLRELEAPG
ncbi:hypothetical protein LFL97_36245 [Burkholderia sp. JSH-S8]|nr:hypothetical protein LFL97_36245 [Burkholderia sp. JSH-S8]